VADLPFPVRMREELVESGKAQLHPVLPQTGWVSYYLSGEEDVAGALDLFEKNCDRLTVRKGAGTAGRAGRRGASDISEVADPGKE
jgi:luciferase-like monooxygenase